MQDLYPPIKIVRHASAKYLRLRVFAHQVRLTVPKACSDHQIEQFLKQSRPWITKTYNKYQQNVTFPTEIQFFNTTLKITQTSQKEKFICDGHTLSINAESSLRAFVLDKAKSCLPDILLNVSKTVKIDYKKLDIRCVKTRWGSCNRQQRIMLNAMLILLPIEIIEYVCIHELVHILHFNHSSAFWQTVEKFCPQYKIYQKQLKNFSFPAWFY